MLDSSVKLRESTGFLRSAAGGDEEELDAAALLHKRRDKPLLQTSGYQPQTNMSCCPGGMLRVRFPLSRSRMQFDSVFEQKVQWNHRSIRSALTTAF